LIGDVQAPAAFGDGADVTGVSAGVPGSQVDGHAGRRDPVGDEPAMTVLTEGSSLRAWAEVSIR
jgi:hypothetical protein